MRLLEKMMPTDVVNLHTQSLGLLIGNPKAPSTQGTRPDKLDQALPQH
jgi:hypothetical protein